MTVIGRPAGGTLGARRVVGVYWGRFNPPHKGHLRVIRRLRKACRLVVAIGSSERKNTRTDPFSARERKAMMEAYLKESGIRGVRVVTLRDGPSVLWALDNLVRRCKPDILLLSTERSGLARWAKGKVKVVRFRRTGRISSTRIRDHIASGDPAWRKWTGRSVARLIVRADGIARIQRAYREPRPTPRRRPRPRGPIRP
jgi:cytidyltransferase-like protein